MLRCLGTQPNVAMTWQFGKSLLYHVLQNACTHSQPQTHNEPVLDALHLMTMRMALAMILIGLTHHVEDPDVVSTFSYIRLALIVMSF